MKEKLINLITEHNVSAIVTMSEKLQIEPEAVIELINELVTEGRLHGTITEDGSRFFRSDAKVSQAPVIERDEKQPEFLSYNTKPGYAAAIVGALLLIAGGIINTNAVDVIEQNFAAGIFMVGILIFFAGLLFIARRNTPD